MDQEHRPGFSDQCSVNSTIPNAQSSELIRLVGYTLLNPQPPGESNKEMHATIHNSKEGMLYIKECLGLASGISHENLGFPEHCSLGDACVLGDQRVRPRLHRVQR